MIYTGKTYSNIFCRFFRIRINVYFQLIFFPDFLVLQIVLWYDYADRDYLCVYCFCLHFCTRGALAALSGGAYLKNNFINSSVEESDEPLISVIVPIFNVKPYLRECLDSIRAQTYSNIEVLAVDDGSTDGSGEICEEYAREDNRFHVFHTVNNGLSAARNFGLDRAKGDFIAFLDSDDYMEGQMLEKLLAACLNNIADIAVCNICNCWVNCVSPDVIQESSTVVFEDEKRLQQAVSMKIVKNAAWNKLYRAGLFSEIRFPRGKMYEDIPTVYKLLLLSERVVWLPETLIHYRMRISSISHLNNAERMVDHWNAYYTKYLNLIDSDLKSCDFTELIANCFLTAKQIWFSYYGFSHEKKNRYFIAINDICLFVRKHFSAIICNRELSFKMKLISPFLLFKCKFVFWYLQKSKAVVNKIKPVDNNICLFFP